MKPEIVIQGNHIHHISSFYEELNRVFMAGENWQLGESLDAFNDLLYGNFGCLSTNTAVTLVWENIAASEKALGYEATRNYYLQKLKPGSTFNQKHFQEKLRLLDSGQGQTYFQLILEIIADHPWITLERR